MSGRDPILIHDAGSVAAMVVRDVLRAAPDHRQWATVAAFMPALAEASPDEFLSAVEGWVAHGPQEVVALLRGESDAVGFGGACLHAGLLWALEGIAWSPQHLARCAVLLGRLADLDPGGRWANRPARSLREIFLPWHPQTAASSAQRLSVLDVLLRRVPRIAWSLLLSLLPHFAGDHAIPTHRPRWRDWDEAWSEG